MSAIGGKADIADARANIAKLPDPLSKALGAMMVEPSDEDERSNSLGLFNTAEAYRLSASVLPIRHGHGDKPPNDTVKSQPKMFARVIVPKFPSVSDGALEGQVSVGGRSIV